jgi:acyl-coenzyme A thioesterase PaaI-like protein
MTTTLDSVLRAGLIRRGDACSLTLDPRLSGLPDTAHGGTVLAAFHALAKVDGAQRVLGTYRKRVPLDTALRVTLASDGVDTVCRLVDQTGAVLVDGGVEPAGVALVGDGVTSMGDAAPADVDGEPLPVSSTCVACGVDNALGLKAQLRFDDERVWTRWIPGETAAREDGSLAPIALTTLLDEAAFWLGALASGESGMTTELAVTIHREIAFGEPVVVIGARNRTRAREDGRYWETEVTAADTSGEIVASGRIVFVAIRGAARRLVAGFLSRSSPEILRRIFPAYAP